MSEYKLTNEILNLSLAKIWDSAKLEWELYQIYEAETPHRCLCGHTPIFEVCILRNTRNLQKATVGNCCVKKFMGLPSDLIFQAVKRVRKDNTKSLNAEAIQHAFDKGWINQWEYDFSMNNLRKQKLTIKQMAKKIAINEKMLMNMKRKA